MQMRPDLRHQDEVNWHHPGVFCASTHWIVQCNVNAFIKKKKKKKNVEEKLGKLTLDQTGTALFSLQCIFSNYYLNLQRKTLDCNK